MTNYFSKNLKYLRKKKNIDQQIMAEDLGIAQSTLSCWENGFRTPDLDMITKISSYLKINDDFITKDLTNEKDRSFKEIENNKKNETLNKLYNIIKDLPEDKQKIILNITEAIIKNND